MDAREFDFVDPDQASEIALAEFNQRAPNPMEASFNLGWREWFEALKTSIVVKRP